MGLFKHKQDDDLPPLTEAGESVDDALNKYFEGVRNRGQQYFEKAVGDQVAKFKDDLSQTIADIDMQLKQYMTERLDEQLRGYTKMMKEAQDDALDSLNRSLRELQDQHKNLASTMQKNVAYQEAVMNHAFQDSQKRLLSLKTIQDTAVQTLDASVQDLKAEHEQLSTVLKTNVTYQEAVLVKAFEDNMALIIEHYLLGALGDQFDLKAQLPGIISQMNANKQAIMDDMKL